MSQWSTVVDGQVYTDPSQIPDLGSWECTGFDENNMRDYQGLSTDVDKLPTYDNLAAGSSALCLDTGVLYLYSAKTKTWHHL